MPAEKSADVLLREIGWLRNDREAGDRRLLAPALPNEAARAGDGSTTDERR